MDDQDFVQINTPLLTTNDCEEQEKCFGYNRTPKTCSSR